MYKKTTIYKNFMDKYRDEVMAMEDARIISILNNIINKYYICY